MLGAIGSEPPDSHGEPYFWLAILACVAMGLSVFAHRDAERGLVRGSRSALALSVLSGVLSVSGLLLWWATGPSDAANASAEP
jgi:hypothetical protein